MSCSAQIAVVIPFYNREVCLEAAIISVLNQTYQDFHLYLVNDASTDASLQVAEKMQELWPKKITILSLSENQGVSAARNRVLKNIDAAYYAFLDSDDVWLAEKLEKQMLAVNQSGLKLCHTEEIWIRNGKRVNQMKKHQKYGGDIFEHCLEMCKMSPSSILIAKEVFNKVGYFREDFPVCEDFDLWLKISVHYKVAYISEPLIKKYGGHEDQLSRKFHSMDWWRLISLIKLLNDEELSSERKEILIPVVRKKYGILKKGYIKHKRKEELENLEKLIVSLDNPAY